MNEPSIPTIKRLFAASGNKCAFPRCTTPLVDKMSGKVTGRICHINASNQRGPRYDPDQTDEERHGFDNLILMCPIHHDVVDSDVESYTVERLRRIKATHEAHNAQGTEPNDEVAKQFLSNISSNTVTHGSIIFTQNQMGGQVAHSITNIGPQPRQISQAAANALIAELLKYPSEQVDITTLLGDPEAYNLAAILEQILKLAGWQSQGLSQSVFTGLPRGVIIETPVQKDGLVILLNWLNNVGLKPQGILRPDASATRIIVGATI